ncbi:MAG TPA: hypothetical protein VGA69_04035 [Nitriliruptorales bacterium]
MELSLQDLRDLIAPAPAPAPSGADPGDPTAGDRLLIRTVTMTLTGRVVLVSPAWIVLDTAAWIADTGRFADAIASGDVEEVEPMGDGVRVARGAIVDVTPWRHDLPTDQQ